MPRHRTEAFKPAPLAELVHDLLETNAGDWFTTDNVVDRITQLRPGAHPDSIRRAIDKARRDHGLETRFAHIDGWTANRQVRVTRRSYLEATA